MKQEKKNVITVVLVFYFNSKTVIVAVQFLKLDGDGGCGFAMLVTPTTPTQI